MAQGATVFPPRKIAEPAGSSAPRARGGILRGAGCEPRDETLRGGHFAGPHLRLQTLREPAFAGRSRWQHQRGLAHGRPACSFRDPRCRAVLFVTERRRQPVEKPDGFGDAAMPCEILHDPIHTSERLSAVHAFRQPKLRGALRIAVRQGRDGCLQKGAPCLRIRLLLRESEHGDLNHFSPHP